MDIVTFSDTRANLKQIMDRVVADRSPIVVTRQKAESVVMLSLSDWRSIEETLHLQSSPANAARLEKAIKQLDAGKGKARDLIDP